MSADISPATEALLKELYTDAKPKPIWKYPDFSAAIGPGLVNWLIGLADAFTFCPRPVIPEMSPETVRLLDELYGHGYVTDAEFERVQAGVMKDYAEVFQQLADA